METSFWIDRWQRNEIGFHQESVNAYLQTFWPRLGLPAGATVFVPLCGKSRDLLWLAAQGYRVLGVEISPIAVAAFFTENGLAPERVATEAFVQWRHDELTLLCGDFFALTPQQLQDVAAVYDRASLIALPPTLRERYVQRLAELLAPGTEVLLISLEYPPHQMQGPPFCIPEAQVHTLYDNAFQVTSIHTESVLDSNPRFRERGLTELREHVYIVNRRGARRRNDPEKTTTVKPRGERSMTHTTDGVQKSIKELYKPRDMLILAIAIPVAVAGAILLAFLMTSR